MDNVSIARRYAEAIYQVAEKNDRVFEIFEMLDILIYHIENDENFKKFLSYPVIDKEKKKELINTIYKDIDEKSLEILNYLIDKNRLLYTKNIFDEYTKLYYEAHKKVVVVATFPKELTEDQKKRLEEKLKKMKQTDVLVHYTVDESLIGGGIVRINDDIIDGSIKTQISKLKS